MSTPGPCIRNCLEVHFAVEPGDLPAAVRAISNRGEIDPDALNPHLAAAFGQVLEVVDEVPDEGAALVGVAYPGLPADHCILRKNGKTICDIFREDSRYPGDDNWCIKGIWKFVSGPAGTEEGDAQ